MLAIEHQDVPIEICLGKHFENFTTYFPVKTKTETLSSRCLIGKASLIVVVCPEEDGNEGQPDDAGRVHREPDVLCLVEVFRNFPA